jgi:hypothetical protein
MAPPYRATYEVIYKAPAGSRPSPARRFNREEIEN